MMCDFIARTNWSNIASNYFMHTIIIFDLSYYTNIMMTVTFVNHPTLCSAFFLFLPKYCPHKSRTIFHINLCILSTYTKVPNGTNKLNHVKRSAVFQNKPFWIPYGRMNHLICNWNKRMLTVVQNTLCNQRAQWLPLVDERFIIDKSVAVSIIFFNLVWQTKLPNLMHQSNRGQWFFVWGLFLRRAHCYQNQWNNALLKEAAIMSKMQTPAITLWFPKHRFKENSHLGFFIKEKQLARQVVFLVKSKCYVPSENWFFVCQGFFSKILVLEFFF